MKPSKFSITGASVVNVVGAILIVYLLVVLAETVKRNYDMGRQIHDLQQQMTLLEDQRDQLSYDIQYFKTDSFREREAREKLGLQMPGESVVIVPRKAPTPTPSAAGSSKPAADPLKRSNFQQWLDFLAGRS